METETKLTLEQLDVLIAQALVNREIANADGIKAGADMGKAITDKDKAEAEADFDKADVNWYKADANVDKYTKLKTELTNPNQDATDTK